MQRQLDVAYGEHARQKLDIYSPRTHAGGGLPVVLFFYGGSWDSGQKGDYLFVAEALTSRGYLVVIADYRLYPEVKFPALMTDPALAVHWVRQHISQYGGNPAQLFLMGHSAGAHLAVMLSVNSAYLHEVGETRASVRGTIGLAGPYDFLPLTSARLQAIFAPADLAWRSQPIHFVDGRNPPLLLMAGLRDRVVWPRNSIRLAEAVSQKGGVVSVRTYPAYDHVDLVAKLARPFRGQSDLLQTIDDWIRSCI